MNIEAGRSERSFLGIRLEDPALNRGKIAYFLAGANVARVLRRIKIENGSAVPKEGPFLGVFAPHTSFWDPPLAYYVVSTQAGRFMRMIAADYVVDPNLEQDPEELEKTGKKPHSKFVRRLISFHAGIGHPISFNRKDGGKSAQEEIDETVRLRRAMTVALQETRKKTSEPNPARVGAASIALRYPDLPLVRMGIVGMERPFGPITVIVNDPITAREILEKKGLDTNGARSLMEVHKSIVSSIADLLPEEAARNLLVRGKELRKNS